MVHDCQYRPGCRLRA
ncbi:hypothetical protein MTR67_002372 [Solanum verrucosum]|uniref:Uncharacterized protein n=1 Tax=Solanum verrucosum TaxID=315347 RepID=A0AAF0PQV5_SOLVR|nr:hypothetical protein MTR67_002372 [Solanum verrucosum]